MVVAQTGIATLSLSHIEETHIQQSTVIQNDTVLTLNYPETITGLSIIMMYKDATITVESGGKLVINGGSIGQADITLKSGAAMNITQNGKVNLKEADSFTAEEGATVLIEQGIIGPN